jgi:hypothetical protein
MPLRALAALFSMLAFFLAAPTVSAQDEHAGHDMPQDSASRGPKVFAGASGIALGTAAAPGINNRTLAEGYFTQPMVMAMLVMPRERFVADLTLNFEGTTLDRGELNAGVHGEGYIDRRHPHTLVHELVGTGNFTFRSLRMSLTAGKGFVPFGTDDPMSRPFVKYPVNHHLAQLLERGLVSAAIAGGRFIMEGAIFNGDEPESPRDLPNWDRFGDSWSARLTAVAAKGVELQGSVARVESPEHATGGGLDHRKVSVSARFESSGRYALAEWARTREGEGNATAFTFSSALAEGAMTLGTFTFAGRAERTERPEEERALNAFRTPRPHSDLGIIGTTRWTIVSVAASAALPSYRRIRFNPFVEVSTQKPVATATPAVFIPAEFYGKSRLWSFSFGARVGVGMRHARMGRYGAALPHNTHGGMK